MHLRKSRGVHPGCAIERIYFETRVVCEEQAGRVAAIVASLQDGILLERQAVFHARLDLFEAREQLNLHRREPRGQAKFPQLPRIAGGA